MMQNEPFNISIAPPVSEIELHNYITLFNEYQVKILNVEDNVVEGALVLCGGSDIGVNAKRDQFEIDLIQQALEKRVPIVGICRGMQLINHYFGGGVEDIPTELNENHLADEFRDDADHHERVSQFHWVKDIKNGHIFVANSRHHQHCIDLNETVGFEATHYSLDNLVEGFINTELRILGVQWHPERNENIDDVYWKQYPLNQIKKWLKDQ